MNLTSPSYFLFLALVYLTFILAPDRFRWLLLLAASYGFYATFDAPPLLLALAFVSGVSYISALRLAREVDESKRKRTLQLGTAGCLLTLVAMRLLPTLAQSFAGALPYVNLLTSVAVSYFTFQAISYLADVYLKVLEPERHLGYHALALAFFPKLLQGPIERAGCLLPQLRKPYKFNYAAMRSGMLLFTLGLYKKVVLADRLALYADAVYQDLDAYIGPPLIIGTYAFGLQLYFDFAGYTDMARGTARMFGIELTENFKSPYQATSIADFWRRWHISFSSWLLDYVFKPLQLAWRGLRQAGAALALILTFLLSGIWHGTKWTFITWGLLHGIYLAVSIYYRPYQKSLYKWLNIERSKWLKFWQIIITFNLVSLAWVFFRAESIGSAWYALTHTWRRSEGRLDVLRYTGKRGALVVLLSIFILSWASLDPRFSRTLVAMFQGSMRWVMYYVLIMLILLCGVFGGGEFIYEKF